MMSFSVALIGAVIGAGAVPTAPRGFQAAEALRSAGVVLIEDVPLKDFEVVAQETWQAAGYPGLHVGDYNSMGSVTRPMVSENVYDVAAGAPKQLPVSPHSEQAYLFNVPRFAAFMCIKAAEKGGELQLFDNVQLGRRLGKLMEQFSRLGITYYRVMGDKLRSANWSYPTGMWQDRFQTDDWLLAKGDDNVVSSAQKPYEEELNNLLTLAKSRGFSNQGEMYSAENLAHLAEEFYGVKCSVISNAFEDQHSTVSQLLKGSAMLVPYDADKNNKPCLENGHRAHWALLTGVLCELCDNSIDWTLFEQDVDVPMLFCVSPLQSFVLPPNCKLGHVYFCVKHGKSKHTVVWTLESLKSSNANLLELDPKRRLAGNCIVPRDGLRVGLCQKIVLMSGKS